MNDTLTAGMPQKTFISIIQACNGGKTEPPKIHGSYI